MLQESSVYAALVLLMQHYTLRGPASGCPAEVVAMSGDMYVDASFKKDKWRVTLLAPFWTNFAVARGSSSGQFSDGPRVSGPAPRSWPWIPGAVDLTRHLMHSNLN